MKYKQFIKQLEKLPHKSKDGRTIADMYADNVEIWSNPACVGYCRIAMERAEIDSSSIDKAIKELYKAFDDYSIEQAEENAIK